jgi:hypothetical protein
MRIPFIEKRNNRNMLGSRNRSHGGGEKEERWLNQVQHVKCVQTKSGDIVYYFKIFSLTFYYATIMKLLKIEEFQNCPNN